MILFDVLGYVIYYVFTLSLPLPLSLSMLFSVATDKLGAVWDVEVGARVKKLKGHSSFVNSVSSSQRGSQIIATGSDDGTARVSCIRLINYYSFFIRFGIYEVVLHLRT